MERRKLEVEMKHEHMNNTWKYNTC